MSTQGGVSAQVCQTPPLDRMTDTCKKHYLAATTLRPVNICVNHFCTKLKSIYSDKKRCPINIFSWRNYRFIQHLQFRCGGSMIPKASNSKGGRAHQPIIWPTPPKKLHENDKIWVGGGLAHPPKYASDAFHFLLLFDARQAST